MQKLILLVAIAVIGMALRPSPCKAQLSKAIALDSCGLHIMGHVLQPGQDTSAWISALGAPTRRSNDELNAVWFYSWDHLGLAIMMEDDGEGLSKVARVFLFFRNLDDTERRANAIGDYFSIGYQGYYSKAELRKLRKSYGKEGYAQLLADNDPKRYVFTATTIPSLQVDGMVIDRESKIASINAARTQNGNMPFWYQGVDWVFPEGISDEVAATTVTQMGYYAARSGPLCAGNGWWLKLHYSSFGRLYYLVMDAYTPEETREFMNKE